MQRFRKWWNKREDFDAEISKNTVFADFLCYLTCFEIGGCEQKIFEKPASKMCSVGYLPYVFCHNRQNRWRENTDFIGC